MSKLNIIYRTKDIEEDYFKGQTYSSFLLEDKTTTISIAPNETRKLIVYGIEKDFQDGFHLGKDEKFEIDDFNKNIMQFEEAERERVDNRMYNILKLLYPQLESGKIATVEEAIRCLEEEVKVK